MFTVSNIISTAVRTGQVSSVYTALNTGDLLAGKPAPAVRSSMFGDTIKGT